MPPRPLGEIAEIVRGISFPKEAKSLEARPGDVVCLRTANVQREVEWNDLWFVPSEHVRRAEQYIRPGDILISTANSYELVGKVAFVSSTPRLATLGAFISLIRPGADVEPKFLYHQLAWGAMQSRIRETASTTTNISNVSTKKLAALDLEVPPLEEQRRIVAEIEKQFSRLADGVATLNRAIANLARYTAVVLKAAVEGRLVPTEAELARREGRSFETGTQLPLQIRDTRKREWLGRGKYSEAQLPGAKDLPTLPAGWDWATVDMVCSRIVDCPHSTPRFVSAGLPCIDTNWMARTGLLSERARFVDEVTYRERVARLEPQTGDIVFAREGTIGTAVLIPPGMKPCLRQRVMLLRCSQFYLNSLMVHVVHSELVRKQYRARALGSTVPHINVADVKRFAVPVPPHAEQRRIVAEVERHFSIVAEFEAQVRAALVRATRLQQAILASAFGH